MYLRITKTYYMKKLLLTLGVVLFSLNISAQLVFVDANGKELSNGTVVTMDKVGTNDWDEAEIKLEGISIRNTSNNNKEFTMDVEVTSLPYGDFSCCFGMTCQSASKATTMTLKNLSISKDATELIKNTEWVLYDPTHYGTCSTKFTLSTGAYIYVNFVNADPASVSASSVAKKIVAIFDLAGNRIKALQRGVNLVRYADGSVRKRIVK